MRKVLSIVLLLAGILAAHAQMKEPKINFECKDHNFGEIKEADGPVTYVFKFTNLGTEPLKIHNVRASCGCTTPVWTKDPILPNGKGELSVTYNPRNRPGSFRKTITVSSNSNPVTLYLSITGKVIPRTKTVDEKYPFPIGVLRAKKTHLSFFNITKGQKKTYGIEVVNTTSKPVKVTFPSLPEHLTSVDRVLAPSEESVLEFVYDASKKNDWGFVSDDVFCWVDGVKVDKAFRVSATITDDFSKLTATERANAPKANLSVRKMDFGTVNRGEKVVKTITLKNDGKSLLRVYAVKSTSSLVTCAVSKSELSVGESTDIQIVVDTEKTRGRQYKTINIISNDPISPNLTFTLSGTVN